MLHHSNSTISQVPDWWANQCINQIIDPMIWSINFPTTPFLHNLVMNIHWSRSCYDKIAWAVFLTRLYLLPSHNISLTRHVETWCCILGDTLQLQYIAQIKSTSKNWIWRLQANKTKSWHSVFLNHWGHPIFPLESWGRPTFPLESWGRPIFPLESCDLGIWRHGVKHTIQFDTTKLALSKSLIKWVFFYIVNQY